MVGFYAKNKNILDEKYLCSHCLLVLKNPVQFERCGHRVCQSCVDIQPRMTIQCPQCSTEQKIWRDKGLEQELKVLPIECHCCHWIGSLKDYQVHLNQKHSDSKCDYCGEQFTLTQSLNEHMVCHCQNTIIPCLLQDFGCDEQIPYCDLEKHYCSEKHNNTLAKIFCQVKLKSKTNEGSSLKMNNNMSQSITVTAANHDIEIFQEYCEMLNISLDDMIISNVNTQQRVNNTLLQCQKRSPTLNFDFVRLQPAIQEIDDSKFISDDGMYIWKITNIKEKMIDAQSERQTSIYSPPFYSSPNGYKMCLRLYLYGDGNARRTHMSLFFVLMRGEYDAILKFPFSYKVTLCLYDQTSERKHIIDSFLPDIKSNSFQRPRSEMNIASGIPKFFPLSMIEQEGNPYVRDDTMFIQVMIDFDGIPKTSLPYVMSLNPGLPAHVRREKIKQEVERHIQETLRK